MLRCDEFIPYPPTALDYEFKCPYCGEFCKPINKELWPEIDCLNCRHRFHSNSVQKLMRHNANMVKNPTGRTDRD